MGKTFRFGDLSQVTSGMKIEQFQSEDLAPVHFIGEGSHGIFPFFRIWISHIDEIPVMRQDQIRGVAMFSAVFFESGSGSFRDRRSVPLTLIFGEHSESRCADSGGVQARSVTYRILGPDYESFMDEFEVSLNEQGYSLRIVDSGWETVSSSFYAMSDRRILMTACAVVAFMAAVLSFVVLLSNHFRYEHALRRLLGALPRDTLEVYVSAFSVTAIPAGFAAVACSFGVYLLWLRDQLSASLPVALPSNGSILAYLAAWAIAELIAAFALLMLFSHSTNKQSLMKLLR